MGEPPLPFASQLAHTGDVPSIMQDSRHHGQPDLDVCWGPVFLARLCRERTGCAVHFRKGLWTLGLPLEQR